MSKQLTEGMKKRLLEQLQNNFTTPDELANIPSDEEIKTALYRDEVYTIGRALYHDYDFSAESSLDIFFASAQMGNSATLTLLLEIGYAGIDDICKHTRNTALHYAVEAGQSKLVVLVLCEKGANVLAKNKVGKTPIDLAADYNQRSIHLFLTEVARQIHSRGKSRIFTQQQKNTFYEQFAQDRFAKQLRKELCEISSNLTEFDEETMPLQATRTFLNSADVFFPKWDTTNRKIKKISAGIQVIQWNLDLLDNTLAFEQVLQRIFDNFSPYMELKLLSIDDSNLECEAILEYIKSSATIDVKTKFLFEVYYVLTDEIPEFEFVSTNRSACGFGPQDGYYMIPQAHVAKMVGEMVQKINKNSGMRLVVPNSGYRCILQ